MKFLAGKTAVDSLLAAEMKVTVPSPFKAPAQKQWNIIAAHTNPRTESLSEREAESQVLKPIAAEARSSPAKTSRSKRKATA